MSREKCRNCPRDRRVGSFSWTTQLASGVRSKAPKGSCPIKGTNTAIPGGVAHLPLSPPCVFSVLSQSAHTERIKQISVLIHMKFLSMLHSPLRHPCVSCDTSTNIDHIFNLRKDFPSKMLKTIYFRNTPNLKKQGFSSCCGSASGPEPSGPHLAGSGSRKATALPRVGLFDGPHSRGKAEQPRWHAAADKHHPHCESWLSPTLFLLCRNHFWGPWIFSVFVTCLRTDL